MPDFKDSSPPQVEASGAETVHIPLAEEVISVSRRKVKTALVRVRVETETRDQSINETLTHHRVEVTRVPIDRYVNAVPAIRQEDDVTIIPVVEEVLVVERRFLLREEVRIQKVRTTEQHIETVSLRRQEAVVTRDAIAPHTKQKETNKECEQ